MALLLLDASFQELLKAGMKSVELAPKQSLSKMGRWGMSRNFLVIN
jgi:hypothetical protein